jgi:hypothetical protein
MEKTVGGIGIINSDLFSDQVFFSVELDSTFVVLIILLSPDHLPGTCCNCHVYCKAGITFVLCKRSVALKGQ